MTDILLFELVEIPSKANFPKDCPKDKAYAVEANLNDMSDPYSQVLVDPAATVNNFGSGGFIPGDTVLIRPRGGHVGTQWITPQPVKAIFHYADSNMDGVNLFREVSRIENIWKVVYVFGNCIKLDNQNYRTRNLALFY